jgi:hypothetical protein
MNAVPNRVFLLVKNRETRGDADPQNLILYNHNLGIELKYVKNIPMHTNS